MQKTPKPGGARARELKARERDIHVKKVIEQNQAEKAAKTARLKAMRLAKEAEDLKNAEVNAKKTKKAAVKKKTAVKAKAKTTAKTKTTAKAKAKPQTKTKTTTQKD